MSTPTTRRRIAGFDPQLRAADADREHVADLLRTGHAEGRIDLDELQQRLGRCYHARTFGELGTLVADLPRGEREGRLPGAWSELGARRWLPLVIGLFVALAVASGGAWHHGQHPPVFLLFAVALVVWRITTARRGRWSTSMRAGPGPRL